MPNKYIELKQKHGEVVNNFPMKFAFSNEQFAKGMKELGLSEKDTDKVYSIGGGGFIRKEDSKAFNDMFKELDAEMQAEIDKDDTGEGFIKEMFIYELGNHEYAYTYDIEPTLDALGLMREEIDNSPKLKHGLQVAKKEYLESAEL